MSKGSAEYYLRGKFQISDMRMPTLLYVRGGGSRRRSGVGAPTDPSGQRCGRFASRLCLCLQRLVPYGNRHLGVRVAIGIEA